MALLLFHHLHFRVGELVFVQDRRLRHELVGNRFEVARVRRHSALEGENNDDTKGGGNLYY